MGSISRPRPMLSEDIDALAQRVKWFEMDGYEVDLDIEYFDTLDDCGIDVYVDGVLAGHAFGIDDLDHVIDNYFEEGGDN